MSRPMGLGYRIVFVLLLSLAHLFFNADAALAFLPAEYECYVPELGYVLPYNEPYSPADGSTCRRYLCRDDNVTLIETCGAVGAGKGCWKVKGDLWLPYPDCCDRVKCKHL